MNITRKSIERDVDTLYTVMDFIPYDKFKLRSLLERFIDYAYLASTTIKE